LEFARKLLATWIFTISNLLHEKARNHEGEIAAYRDASFARLYQLEPDWVGYIHPAPLHPSGVTEAGDAKFGSDKSARLVLAPSGRLELGDTASRLSEPKTAYDEISGRTALGEPYKNRTSRTDGGTPPSGGSNRALPLSTPFPIQSRRPAETERLTNNPGEGPGRGRPN